MRNAYLTMIIVSHPAAMSRRTLDAKKLSYPQLFFTALQVGECDALCCSHHWTSSSYSWISDQYL